MKISKLSLSISLLLFILFTWVGCVSDLEEYSEGAAVGDTNTDTSRYLTLSISLPSISTPSSDTNTTSDNIDEEENKDFETSLKEVDVLVFEEKEQGEYLSYITQAVKIQNSNSGLKSFEAKLEQSKKSEKYRIVIVANVHAAVEAAQAKLTEGEEIKKEDFLSLLTFRQTGAWNISDKGMPLWGETSSTHHIVHNTKGGEFGIIKMLRAMARIDVVSSLSTDEFELTNVVVYNINKSSLVVPQFIYDESEKDFIQVKPSLVNSDEAPLEKISYTVEGDSEMQKIYIGEALNEGKDKLQKLCLVIGGKYKGSTKTTWYRVDFDAEKQTSADLSTSNIVRNYLYKMKITSVSKAGADTDDGAFAKVDTDMTVTINAWDLYELGNIVFDNQHFLSINPTGLSYDKDPVIKDTIYISTDVFADTDGLPTFKLYDHLNTNEISPIKPFWIKNLEIIALDSDNTKFGIVYDISENKTGKTRNAYLRISASERLTVALKVSQIAIISPSIEIFVSEFYESVDDASFLKTNATYFVDSTNGGAVGKTMKIRYKPADATLKIIAVKQNNEIAWSGTEAPPIGPHRGNGEIIQKIKPLPISRGTAMNGDFDEHSYKIIAFLETENGVLSKSLTFIQAKPGVFIEADDMMLIDGKNNYNFVVKSSVPWSLSLKRNEASKLGWGQAALKPFSAAWRVGRHFIGNDILIKSGPSVFLEDGQPNLHKNGEVMPIESQTNFTPNVSGLIFAGYLDFEVKAKSKSSTAEAATFYKEILMTTGIDQTNLEANCYVLNPKSPVGIMIPIRENMEMFDNSLANPKLANSSRASVPSLFGVKLFPKLVWTDVKQSYVGRIGVDQSGVLQPSWVYPINDFIRFVGVLEFKGQKYLLVLPGEKAQEGGNAIVAVTNGMSGTILRSWHIWITDLPFEGEPLKSIVKSGYQGSGLGPWLDRDLGALGSKVPTTQSELNQTIGLYYQFGRKEPFPKAKDIRQVVSNLTPSYYIPTEPSRNVNSSVVMELQGATTSYVTKPIGYGTVSSVLNNPLALYYNSDLTAWKNEYTTDYWYTAKSRGESKSIFDPCPAGYRVPSTDNTLIHKVEAQTDWTLVELLGTQFAGNLSYLYKVFYPVTGIITFSKVNNPDTSVIAETTMNTEGQRWESNLFNRKAHTFKLNSLGASTFDDANTITGKSVRCVRSDTK